jgi:hypothetical protein
MDLQSQRNTLKIVDIVTRLLFACIPGAPLIFPLVTLSYQIVDHIAVHCHFCFSAFFGFASLKHHGDGGYRGIAAVYQFTSQIILVRMSWGYVYAN